MGDFLKQDVKTPLCGHYFAAGVSLKIETNSESILEIARGMLERRTEGDELQEHVRLKLWVEDEPSPQQQFKPYFRGLGHLVFSGYDERSSLMINLRDRSGAGRFSRTLAENARYWKTVLFPSLVGIVGPSVGLTSLHSACVASEGNGLLLAGESGSGKSSLSLALARTGLDFLCDDRTLIKNAHGKLTAWGLFGEMKQRSDAVAFFPELRHVNHREIWNREFVLRFDPVELFGIRRVAACEPRWVVFLDRQRDPTFSLEEISAEECITRLASGLHEESPETTTHQRQTIEALSRSSCYRLRYGGNPRTVAGALREIFWGETTPAGKLTEARQKRPTRIPAVTSDPLRRFRPTCLRTDVILFGKHIRIETDNPVVLTRISEVLKPFDTSHSGVPQVLWRIVCEPPKEPALSWPSMTAFCDRSLRYINLGQRSFVAADLVAREAVGVLPETLCEDPIGFSTVFLASLLHLTAPVLGLTPISAASVARGENGLLLFGPPNSGKTTASYWGRKLGLDFHSDQAVFLEAEGNTIRAWGDFWPAAFRPETAEFLPEISKLGRPFRYRDRSFLCIDKGILSNGSPRAVAPVACIFLERQAASRPRLMPVSYSDVTKQLVSAAGSHGDCEDIVALLSRLPCYRLLYDEDPQIAALFFRSVLEAHELMEQRV